MVTALDLVGLSDRMHHRPGQLSGGQQQRVGIARAIVTDPTLIVADEPTGDLDAKSADEILDLLCELKSSLDKTIIMVTHDERAADRADRIVELQKGQLVNEPAAVRDLTTLRRSVFLDSSVNTTLLRSVAKMRSFHAISYCSSSTTCGAIWRGRSSRRSPRW